MRNDPTLQGHVCAGNEWVGIGTAGEQYLVFVARDAKASEPGYTLFASTRTRADLAWSAPTRVDPSSRGSDDKPMLLIDATPRSPRRGRVYVAWTRRDTGSVFVAYTDDRGAHWSEPLQLEQGWGAHLALAGDGVLYAAWWNSTGKLQIAKSTDGGAHFGRPVAFRSLYKYVGLGVGYVPAMRAQLVHPDPSLAADASQRRYRGRLYAAYSVPRAGVGGRVIMVTALDPNLRPLLSRIVAPPQRQNGRDAFNPTVAVDQSNGTVWLCFYLSGSGRKRILATYSCSTSKNGGRSWSRLRSVASVPSNEAQRGGFATSSGIDSNYASYEGLAVQGGVAYPVWTDTRKLKRLREEIYASRMKG